MHVCNGRVSGNPKLRHVSLRSYNAGIPWIQHRGINGGHQQGHPSKNTLGSAISARAFSSVTRFLWPLRGPGYALGMATVEPYASPLVKRTNLYCR